MPDHEISLYLLPGYALDALDDGERWCVATHLDTCPICRTELAKLAEVIALLAFATPCARPQPHVKDALSARIGARGNARVDPAPARRDPRAGN